MVYLKICFYFQVYNIIKDFLVNFFYHLYNNDLENDYKDEDLDQFVYFLTFLYVNVKIMDIFLKPIFHTFNMLFKNLVLFFYSNYDYSCEKAKFY